MMYMHIHSHHQPNTASHSKFFLYFYYFLHCCTEDGRTMKQAACNYRAKHLWNNSVSMFYDLQSSHHSQPHRASPEVVFTSHLCLIKGNLWTFFRPTFQLSLCRSQLTAPVSLHLMENPSADLGEMNVQHYFKSRGSDSPLDVSSSVASKTWGWVYLCHQIASPQIRAQINATRSSRWRCVCYYLSFKAFMSLWNHD